MKNGKIYLSLAFLSAVMFGCQKEAPIASDSVAQPYVETVLSFSIGERAYTLRSIQSVDTKDSYGYNGCGGVCADVYETEGFAASWTSYIAGSNFVSVTRQDNADAPALRMTLSGTSDLTGIEFPMKLDNAYVLLSDFDGRLIEPTDDPATSTGNLYFESKPGKVDITVNSRKGNVVEGTFSGSLQMLTSGTTVELKDGTFTAQLKGL